MRQARWVNISPRICTSKSIDADAAPVWGQKSGLKVNILMMFQANNTNMMKFQAIEQNRALHEVWLCL
jgi:hypothetical protein